MRRQNDNSAAITGSHRIRSDLGSSKRSDLILFGLLFVLLAAFLVHNFDSIGQDIGRHLKIGEIIWQTKEVPKVNLFSFTEPNFPFINHHWLSEVIFYGIFSRFGFAGLILLKAALVLFSFLLLFRIFRGPPLPRSGLETSRQEQSLNLQKGLSLSWPVFISFLLSIFIFISRTEARPEIFSFAILALFLFVLFRAKYSSMSDLKNPQGPPAGEAGRTFNYLWLLPVLQIFWVNLHIYFFIGPFLVLAFLTDRLVSRPSKLNQPRSDLFKDSRSDLKMLARSNLVLVLFLTIAATFVNPNGIQGALLPFKILKEYGYSIVENQTLAFLSGFFGFDLSVFVFKLSAAVMAVSFLLTVKRIRQRIFELIISAFFVYAGFKMFRNLPLYALGSFPVLAILLTDIFNLTTYAVVRNLQDLPAGEASRTLRRGWLSKVSKAVMAIFLVFMIFFVASGGYYKKIGSSKAFGFSVPNSLERAVNFVKENKIEGPMFNNFDTGGYLIWKIQGVRYPFDKVPDPFSPDKVPDPFRVFVDNRPEAYSVDFFSKIYKPMQENKDKWTEFSEKYNINFIFFAYADATPWGETFLGDIVKNPGWRIVYINETAIILVKNNKSNGKIISDFVISETNAADKVAENIKDSNTDKTNLNTTLSLLFYKINWAKPSIYFADEAIKSDPKTPRPYLFKGFVYARRNDLESQKLAGENIKKAIDLGLKESQYYYILGVVYMNLGRLVEAKTLFERALALDKNNAQAREFLVKYFPSTNY